MKNFKYIAIAALGLVACEPELKNSPVAEGAYNSGNADFSTFVSVGNSLTAGYADGTVFLDGQKNSFPNILANRFSVVGGGEFTQPLVNDNLGGLTLAGTPITETRLILQYDAEGNKSLVRKEGTPTTDITNILSGNFNNMGVPGAKSFHIGYEGYGSLQGVMQGSANPYFVRFASSPNATILGDAIAQNPTFYSLWIGNNDVLSYATSGGVGVDQTGNMDPSTYGANDITDPNVVGYVIQQAVGALSANDAKGIIMNIPSVTSIPYFTTVPHNPIPMDSATANYVNGVYADYNQGLLGLVQAGAITADEAAQRSINFIEGQNPPIIIDESLTDLTGINPQLISMRMATEDDLIVLPASTFIGTLADPNNPASVNGVGIPLADMWVLTADEISKVNTAQTAYNAAIEGLAASNPNLALVDTKSFMDILANGGLTLESGGVITDTFGTGGAFSLDGVHPTAKGYAVIANLAIDVINSEYNANVPKVNEGSYPTVYIQ